MVDFVGRWREVGGWPPKPMKLIPAQPELDLPFYIPKIHHGHRREIRFTGPLAALPTFAIVGRRRDGTYGVRDRDAAELRERFKIGHSARVLLVSVDKDNPLESYWRSRNVPDEKVPVALARLGVVAMTVPNYSFFDDAPRPHTLWNRQRMIRVTEELSDAGIVAIPHLNAQYDADWDFWRSLLKSQKGMRYISKEFQTGLALKERGLPAIERLRRLQDEVGRELHPILHGAADYIEHIARAFRRYTIVDSNPFFMTIHRQVWVREENDKFTRKRYMTPEGQPLDLLLEHNVAEYEERLRQAVAPLRRQDQRQLSLPF
jgi:hypothetical protein